MLISTLAPGPGGVGAMTRFVVDVLSAQGYEPVLAHYAPYRSAPELSAPSFRLLQRRPAARRQTAFAGIECHAIGAWLPELEFTHYLPTPEWERLMQGCAAWVAVSGNVLAATPFARSGRHFLAWVATDWAGDRRDRVRSFPLLRRCLDAALVSPVIRRLERQLLRAGSILPLSDYTSRMLSGLSGQAVHAPSLPMCIDTRVFAPAPHRSVPRRIGFAGRYNDPRKNIGLLLRSVAELKRCGEQVSVLLVGDTPDEALVQTIGRLGIAELVTFEVHVSQAKLVAHLQSLDLFVLPSQQEGLCIAALEAMACGVPVVSTRCGGPEEFVLPGRSGELVESHPQDMASAIGRILADRPLRDALGEGALQVVRSRYTREHAEAVFLDAFHSVFPALRATNVTHTP